MKTFAVNEHIISLGGIEIKGFAPGTYCAVAYDDKRATFSEGADGEVARVLTLKTMGKANFTLQQTSSSNDALSVLALADYAGNIPLPLLIKDLSGRTFVESTQSTIDQLAGPEWADTPTTRVWQVVCPKLIIFVGGN